MASFDWAVNKAVKNAEPRTLRSDMGDGFSQRVGSGLNPNLPKWDVEIKRVYTTIQDIDAFLVDKGGHTNFTWTPPRGSEGKYICETWNVDNLGGDIDVLTATFELTADI